MQKGFRLIFDLFLKDGTLVQHSTENIIQACFEEENQRFRETIKRGYHQLKRILKENQGKALSGSQIVSLEKDKGFLHQLTAIVLHEKGLSYAETEYKKELNV